MNNYINRIKFIANHRNLPIGFEIAFNASLTLLLGNNSSGKSTILSLIKDSYKKYHRLLAKQHDTSSFVEFEKAAVEPQAVLSFDFHGDDKKFAGHLSDDLFGQIQAMHQSSGISILNQLQRTGIVNSMDSLILLDEPCRGLSPKLQNAMAERLLMMSRTNQLIVSTHSERIMNLFMSGASLFSVEHGRFVNNTDEFLVLHLSE